MLDGLSRAPFVDVKLNGREIRALVDTGADWSLLDAESLSAEELTGLSKCEARGQGVSREPISILGEVWRDVTLGEVCITQQRFVVVRDMVTKAILGADFWVRIGEMTLNFGERLLSVDHLDIRLRLYESDEGEEESMGEARMNVELSEQTEIPPHTEKLVVVRVPKCRDGQKILVEPVGEDESPVNVPFTVCRVTGGQTAIRIANIGSSSVKLQKETADATIRRCYNRRCYNSGSK